MSEAASEPKRDWKLSLVVAFGYYLIRVLASTWRIRAQNTESFRDLRAKKQPFIFAFWHGQLFPLLWVHRDEGVAVLVSSHRDGEIVARIAERLGMRTVRGSTTRGAARALLGVVRELQDGREVAVTPDGPRGPAKRFASGALVAAQRARAPIIAIGVRASRAWRLKSWDRFMIPKPFARIDVVYSAPTYVTAGSPREAEDEAPRFESLIGETIDCAERA
ncbi:MAG TPA: lysophospholipid acyltransferase family protein [Gemmatimonadaceae bacterium]|nr:lysophospholipid acyltransferase family protein [Gemmatimonadaceae bacterium]